MISLPVHSRLISAGILVLVWLSLNAPGFSRVQEERPDVHSEFVFGSFPYSTEGASLLMSAEARLMLAAFDQGWSVDKVLSETEGSELDLLEVLDDLEQENLVRGPSDFDLRPGLLLVRETEAATFEPELQADAARFAEIIGAQWDDVEEFIDSLEAGTGMPRAELLYDAVVGGVLIGGMIDAFLDDQTLMPGPPRRGRGGTGYYAWLIEGTLPESAVIRQDARVGRYTVYSVGTGVQDEVRIQIQALRDEGSPVFEAADAERWRVFSSVFSRDHLFPYFKSRRSALLDLHGTLRSSRYAAFAEFVAWYYQGVVERTVRGLVAAGRIVRPESSFRYAMRTGR